MFFVPPECSAHMKKNDGCNNARACFVGTSVFYLPGVENDYSRDLGGLFES